MRVRPGLRLRDAADRRRRPPPRRPSSSLRACRAPGSPPAHRSVLPLPGPGPAGSAPSASILLGAQQPDGAEGIRAIEGEGGAGHGPGPDRRQDQHRNAPSAIGRRPHRRHPAARGDARPAPRLRHPCLPARHRARRVADRPERGRPQEDLRRPPGPDRPRLLPVQAEHHPPPHRAAHGPPAARDPRRLPQAPPAHAGRGERPLRRPAHRGHPLLPRPGGLRGPEGRGGAPALRGPRPGEPPPGAGSRAAPPARRPTPWPSSSRSTSRPPDATTASRSSPPTSTPRPSPPPGPASTPPGSPPTSPRSAWRGTSPTSPVTAPGASARGSAMSSSSRSRTCSGIRPSPASTSSAVATSSSTWTPTCRST